MASVDLNAALFELLETRKQGPSFLEITKTTEIQQPDAGNNMLRIFQEAFPEMEFSLGDVEGKPNIRGMKKVAPPDASKYVPDGYSPQLAARGITEMQTALEAEPDELKRLEISTKLLAMVNTQKAHNFNTYKSRAEAEFGVADLITAADRVKQAEMSSPHNPQTGMPSLQRLQLLETLGVARQRAANRVKELADNDITLAGAENLAKATILSVEKGALAENRRAIIEDRDSKRYAREAAISSMEPALIQNISILRNAQAQPDDAARQAIAAGLYDGKIKLTEFERAIVTANPESLRGLYLLEKDPKKREQVLQLLSAKEEAASEDPIQAKRNMDLFRKVYSVDPSDQTQTRDPAFSDRVRRDNQNLLVRYPDKKARDEVGAQNRVAFQNEHLANVVNQAFQSDVSTWGGLVQSDETAKNALSRMRKTNPNDMGLRRFISTYLAETDGKDLATKSKSLQAVISSAFGAFPRSVVLPIPSEESLMLQMQSMMASAYVADQYRRMKDMGLVFGPGRF